MRTIVLNVHTDRRIPTSVVVIDIFTIHLGNVCGYSRRVSNWSHTDHGLCIGEEFTYRCKCNPGFDGLFCEKRHNLCYNLTCENGGSCQLDDEGIFI